MLADAYAKAGLLDSARAEAKRLEALWPFGIEAQPAWRRAALRAAKLALQAGDTVEARVALGRQLTAWKDADTEFPDLVETRRLLGQLTSRR